MGADLESWELALPEETIHGGEMQLHRGMQPEEFSEFTNGHGIALKRRLYLVTDRHF